MASLSDDFGAPSRGEMARTHAAAQSQKNVNARVQATNLKNDFPYVPVPYDPYDTAIMSKLDLAGDHFQYNISDKDVAWYERKRDAQEQANYDAWVHDLYDLKDPAQAAMFQKMCPSLYERKKQLVDYKLNVEKRAAMIRMLGPQNEDDLKFLWLIDTGRIQLDEVPVWRHTEYTGEVNTAAFKRGMFNPLTAVAKYWPIAGNNVFLPDTYEDPIKSIYEQPFKDRASFKTYVDALKGAGPTPHKKAGVAAQPEVDL